MMTDVSHEINEQTDENQEINKLTDGSQEIKVPTDGIPKLNKKKKKKRKLVQVRNNDAKELTFLNLAIEQRNEKVTTVCEKRQ